MNLLRQLFLSCTLILGLMSIVGTGGGGGGGGTSVQPPQATISGTAAAGAPIVGTVNLKDAVGNTSLSAIEADGSYSIDIDGSWVPPFVLWAQGTAAGREVRLYSTIEGSGVACITPATNMVMAMALGSDPQDVYHPNDELAPSASAPRAADVEAAKEEIAALLESVFASLDLPDEFDLFETSFDADGTGIDALFDVVDMTATGNTVEMKDKSSAATLFEKTGGTVVQEMTPDDINTIVAGNLTKKEQIEAVLKNIGDLYATGVPSLAELRALLLPGMSADFLENGYGADDYLENWLLEDEGPSVGMTITNVVIHRQMESNLDIGPFGTWNELAGNYAGEWIFFIGTESGGRPFAHLSSFVQETQGGPWKWYGNRNPFVHGGDVGAQAVKQVNVATGEIFKFTGLDFWTDDIGNQALVNFNINAFAVANSALPLYPGPGGVPALILGRPDNIITQYMIDPTNRNQPDIWNHMYAERYSRNLVTYSGLNIDDMVDPEFVFVGFNTAAQNQALNVWIDVLGANPLTLSEVTDDYFATPTSPSTMADVAIPGDVTVSWQNPARSNMWTDYVNIHWGDFNGDSQLMDADKPVGLSDWTSVTFDTSAATVLPQAWFGFDISGDDQFDRDFNIQSNNLP